MNLTPWHGLWGALVAASLAACGHTASELATSEPPTEPALAVPDGALVVRELPEPASLRDHVFATRGPDGTLYAWLLNRYRVEVRQGETQVASEPLWREPNATSVLRCGQSWLFYQANGGDLVFAPSHTGETVAIPEYTFVYSVWANDEYVSIRTARGQFRAQCTDLAHPVQVTVGELPSRSIRRVVGNDTLRAAWIDGGPVWTSSDSGATWAPAEFPGGAPLVTDLEESDAGVVLADTLDATYELRIEENRARFFRAATRLQRGARARRWARATPAPGELDAAIEVLRERGVLGHMTALPDGRWIGVESCNAEDVVAGQREASVVRVRGLDGHVARIAVEGLLCDAQVRVAPWGRKIAVFVPRESDDVGAWLELSDDNRLESLPLGLSELNAPIRFDPTGRFVVVDPHDEVPWTWTHGAALCNDATLPCLIDTVRAEAALITRSEEDASAHTELGLGKLWLMHDESLLAADIAQPQPTPTGTTIERIVEFWFLNDGTMVALTADSAEENTPYSVSIGAYSHGRMVLASHALPADPIRLEFLNRRHGVAITGGSTRALWTTSNGGTDWARTDGNVDRVSMRAGDTGPEHSCFSNVCVLDDASLVTIQQDGQARFEWPREAQESTMLASESLAAKYFNLDCQASAYPHQAAPLPELGQASAVSANSYAAGVTTFLDSSTPTRSFRWVGVDSEGVFTGELALASDLIAQALPPQAESCTPAAVHRAGVALDCRSGSYWVGPRTVTRVGSESPSGFLIGLVPATNVRSALLWRWNDGPTISLREVGGSSSNLDRGSAGPVANGTVALLHDEAALAFDLREVNSNRDVIVHTSFITATRAGHAPVVPRTISWSPSQLQACNGPVASPRTTWQADAHTVAALTQGFAPSGSPATLWLEANANGVCVRDVTSHGTFVRTRGDGSFHGSHVVAWSQGDRPARATAEALTCTLQPMAALN